MSESGFLQYKEFGQWNQSLDSIENKGCKYLEEDF